MVGAARCGWLSDVSRASEWQAGAEAASTRTIIGGGRTEAMEATRHRATGTAHVPLELGTAPHGLERPVEHEISPLRPLVDLASHSVVSECPSAAVEEHWAAAHFTGPACDPTVPSCVAAPLIPCRGRPRVCSGRISSPEPLLSTRTLTHSHTHSLTHSPWPRLQ